VESADQLVFFDHARQHRTYNSLQALRWILIHYYFARIFSHNFRMPDCHPAVPRTGKPVR